MSNSQEHHGPSDSRALLHLDCLSHVYSDGTVGIHELCFKVMPNEIVVICGPNGSGKSTLLEHLNGILIPSNGNILLYGEKITKNNVEKLRRAVGLVFQDADSQLIAPTVLDDVMFGVLNSGIPLGEAITRANWALDLVGFKALKKIPHYLSGGEKRLVAIAGIIAMKPKIIVVDEPTSDLDPINAENIEMLLTSLRDTLGVSVVISTHDMDLAARVADRIYLLKKGNVVSEGTARELFYDESIMEEVNMKPPLVTRLYKEMVKEGLAKDGEKPVTVSELIAATKKADINRGHS